MASEHALLSRIAYYRVSTGDQSIERQRQALQGPFDREFADEDVSGMIRAVDRPGFAALLAHVRRGDTVCVESVDRLGRDALDVQGNVRELIAAGVRVDVLGLGALDGPQGELILAVLAQVADMERKRILERTSQGRAAARTSLEATGRTHRGKEGLGRRFAADAPAVAAWRAKMGASITSTAQRFGISSATVKRYCRAASTIDGNNSAAGPVE